MVQDDELVECAFLIPLVRNSDRQPHRPACWNALHDALFSRFGGRTGPELIYRTIRPVPGEYRDDAGTRVTDENWRYIAAVPRRRLDDLRRLLRQAANTFDQDEIYLSVAGLVEFLGPSPEDGSLL